VCVVAALWTGLPSTPLLPGDGRLTLVPAADFIVEAFVRVPLVAFSEPGHGAGGTRAFLASVLRHPRFTGTVNDVVVEFGNARYQAVADRYVSGETVVRDELRRIWENTTVATAVWTAPMYEGFLDDVRSLNASLPPARRVRVVLGDPPVDWSAVRGPADEDMNDWRDAHFAWIVQKEVLEKGRRALLWMGGAHLTRKVRFPDSMIHLLDRRYPRQTLVVLAADRANVDEEAARRLGRWPALMATPVRNTWMGQLDASRLGLRLSTGTVDQNIDAVIFWDSAGPDDGPPIASDSRFVQELRRRRQLAEATTAFRGGKIRFQENSAAFAPGSETALRAVLAELKRDRRLTLLVKAFADAREATPDQLSRARAQAVSDWLAARGVPRDRLAPRGCGSSRALWIGDTEQERAANRRAEIVRRSPREGCDPPAAFDFR
jgi:outer membrane protein OmpA-like peptidoglycan-associated protein